MEPGATTELDFGRGCDFALEKGGVLLPELRNQWGGFFLGRGESYAAGLCLGGLIAGQAQG